MKITFEEAYEVLDKCSAVIWDDTYLSYPRLLDGEDEDASKDVFLELECDDCSMKFVRGDNEEVMVAGASLWLKNMRGESIQVSVLCPAEIVKVP